VIFNIIKGVEVFPSFHVLSFAIMDSSALADSTLASYSPLDDPTVVRDRFDELV
jgi:hypothetical protein